MLSNITMRKGKRKREYEEEINFFFKSVSENFYFLKFEYKNKYMKILTNILHTHTHKVKSHIFEGTHTPSHTSEWRNFRERRRRRMFYNNMVMQRQ